jgi:GGDEF domain-containing protein
VKRVIEVTADAFDVDGHLLQLSISTGYATSLNDTLAEAGELMRRADMAMYRDKHAGTRQAPALLADTSRFLNGYTPTHGRDAQLELHRRGLVEVVDVGLAGNTGRLVGLPVEPAGNG